MQSKIWICSQKRIHIHHQGQELEFEDMQEFMNVLMMWQEFVLSQHLEEDLPAEEFWAVFKNEAKN